MRDLVACTFCQGKQYSVLARIDGQDIAMACPCCLERLGKVTIPGDKALATMQGVFGVRQQSPYEISTQPYPIHRNNVNCE